MHGFEYTHIDEHAGQNAADASESLRVDAALAPGDYNQLRTSTSAACQTADALLPSVFIDDCDSSNPGDIDSESGEEPPLTNSDQSDAEYGAIAAPANDYGHWSERLTGSQYQPSASEANGLQAVQILSGAHWSNPTQYQAAVLQVANLILNSPNPEHAAYTANNGHPLTPGFFGIGAQYTDSLAAHGMHLELNYSQQWIPPVGQPTHAAYQPGYFQTVPTSITLHLPAGATYPALSARH